MPAKDFFHDHVKNALIKDGWTITDDPLHLKWGGKDLYVDLGAEQLLAAEKANKRIAVEIKSFLGPSDMADLESALGQFELYSVLLGEIEPDRQLYLAVSEDIWIELFQEPLGQLLLAKKPLRVLVFDPEREVIVQWIT
jgi:hypothetical protein